MKNGFSGIVTFFVKGGLDEARRFLERCRCLHDRREPRRRRKPGRSSRPHDARFDSAGQRKALGIDDSLIRLSVGIEDVRDLLEDLRAGAWLVGIGSRESGMKTRFFRLTTHGPRLCRSRISNPEPRLRTLPMCGGIAMMLRASAASPARGGTALTTTREHRHGDPTGAASVDRRRPRYAFQLYKASVLKVWPIVSAGRSRQRCPIDLHAHGPGSSRRSFRRARHADAIRATGSSICVTMVLSLWASAALYQQQGDRASARILASARRFKAALGRASASVPHDAPVHHRAGRRPGSARHPGLILMVSLMLGANLVVLEGKGPSRPSRAVISSSGATGGARLRS